MDPKFEKPMKRRILPLRCSHGWSLIQVKKNGIILDRESRERKRRTFSLYIFGQNGRGEGVRKKGNGGCGVCLRWWTVSFVFVGFI